MASTSGVALVANPINLTGVLFNKTRIDTPLFNGIKNTTGSSRTFITGATYETGYPTAVADGITEQASLTAPTPEFWTRDNAMNVTQMFQRAIQVSYRKQANGADLNNYLSGGVQQPAIVGNTNNVPSELAFQLTNVMDSIRLDIENCIINGQYNDSQGVATAKDSTRGLLQATTSNVLDGGGYELKFEHLYDIAQMILLAGSPYGLENYLVIMNYQQYKQLQKLVADQGLKIDTTEAGVNVMRVITPFGVMRFLPHRFMPNGTIEIACMPILGNKLQPTPGKGNFFFEPLAKTGASDAGQVFGMWGLDHGPEFMHAKITNLATTTTGFTPPKRYIVNGTGLNVDVTVPATTTTVFGKTVSQVQTGVSVSSSNVVTGTLKKITSWDEAGFDMSKGNHFLVLHAKTDNEGATIIGNAVPSQGSPTPAFTDDDVVIQVKSDYTTGVSFTVVKGGEDSVVRNLTLNVTLEA